MRTGRPPTPGNIKTAHACKYCGAEFMAYVDRRRSYCSKKCFYADGASRSDPDRKREFKCEYCSNLFTDFLREDRRYCSIRCHNLARPTSGLGEPGNRRYMNEQGYILVCSNGDDDYRLEHRVVVERMIGRKLRKNETIHHKNGIRHDNREENLELWSSNHGWGQRADDQDIWSGTIPAYQFGAL